MRTVFGFIDAKGDSTKDEHVGDVRRANGWKRPAKLKTHLGNIFDEHGGMAYVTADGPRPMKKGDQQTKMTEKSFDLLRDVPCQVNYLCGDGWQPHTLVGDADYIVSDLVTGDNETTFALHDEKGVIACYRLATSDFQQQFKEKA
jgi:hypothetical protein